MPNEKPDVFVVIRQRQGGRPTMAFPRAVYPTHEQALNAMNKHKDALRKFSSPRDAKEVRIKVTDNPRRLR